MKIKADSIGEQKIKICHITTVHSNRYDVRIFEKECTSLVKEGYDVVLIVNDGLSDEIRNGVKIISLGIQPKNRLDRATRIAFAAHRKALEIDADLYHIHDPELLRIGTRLRRSGKIVIFDSHEFTCLQIQGKQYLPKMTRGIISKIYQKYEESHLRKLSGMVIPCTYDGRDFFFNIKIPKVIIRNYPKQDIEQIQQDSTRKYENKVCYAGNIAESRGLSHMMKACAIAGKKLILIGSISDELRQGMEALSEYENVEFLGELPHEAALKEMSKCAVGLAVLKPEGQYEKVDILSTKVCEYMMLGIPSVVSNFPFVKKALSKYEFGLAVNPLDDQAIAEAITRIISDQCLAEHMAQEGRRAISEEMNWENDARKLVAFYRRLVGETTER